VLAHLALFFQRVRRSVEIFAELTVVSRIPHSEVDISAYTTINLYNNRLRQACNFDQVGKV
jgi:hypothetical protein